MRKGASLILATAIAIVLGTFPGIASAQSGDVVVMRRTVAPPNIDAAPSRARGEWVVGAWLRDSAAPACTANAGEHRSVECMNGDRRLTDDKCVGTKPETTRVQTRTDGCTTAWTTGEYGAYDPNCSSAATRTRSVSCQRSGGDLPPEARPESECSGTKPRATETAEYTGGCTYTPEHGAYGTCTETWAGSVQGTQTAPFALCRRSDGTVADPSRCSQAPLTRYCTISYTPGHGAYGTCIANQSGGTQGTQSAPVTSCTRSTDGASVPLSYCSQDPATRSCSISYTPTYGAFGACMPKVAGGTEGTRTKTITSCTRSSDNASLTLSFCSPQQITEDCTVQRISSCGSLTAGKAPTNASAAVNVGYATGGSPLVSSAAQAVAACNAYLDTHAVTSPVVCYYTAAANNGSNVRLFTTSTMGPASGQELASSCN